MADMTFDASVGDVLRAEAAAERGYESVRVHYQDVMVSWGALDHAADLRSLYIYAGRHARPVSQGLGGAELTFDNLQDAVEALDGLTLRCWTEGLKWQLEALHHLPAGAGRTEQVTLNLVWGT